MLIKAGKPNFDGLREVAKQLLIWSYNRKQDFHSRHENDYKRDYRPRRKSFERYVPRRKWDARMFDDDFDYDGGGGRKAFDLEKLKPFEKNFYTPHPNVVNRSESEIREFYEKHNIQIFGNNAEKCPNPIFSFEELNLPSETLDVVSKLGYTEPTPIQSQTWPIALSGLNMVGVAQTGSGKTLGFVLPGLIHLQHQPPREAGEGPIALMISPTRELAQQIHKVLVPFAQSCRFKTACVFGGVPKERQSDSLERAHICVGTPGRVIDFLKSGCVNLSRCTYFVLDEADLLLDMGFEPQIKAIMNRMRPDSQVLMWSATWPKEVQHLASEHVNEFIGVKFGSSELSANPNIVQRIHVCNGMEKRSLLLKLLKEIFESEDQKTLIFAQTKSEAAEISFFLRNNNYRTVLLHGSKSQLERDRALEAFRSGRAHILVGTGVVGRGLDISDIKHVINYDFPNVIENYVHIIGRTGRSNNVGTAHTFFTPEDARFADDLIKILKQTNQEINPELLELANSRRPEQPPKRYFHYGNRYRRSGYN